MHALRQLHELMLCGEAAEHQLALISDAAEIADTYPTPPDEVQSGNPQTTTTTTKKKCPFQKNGGVDATRTSITTTANLK